MDDIRLAGVGGALLALACSRPLPPEPGRELGPSAAPGTSLDGVTTAARSSLAPDGPRVVEGGLEAPVPLVVAVVFDQLGSDTLLRLLPGLEPDGVLRTALGRGVYFERSTYPYKNTLTAPGHAATFTGAAPARNGVVGNEEWDRATNSLVAAVFDPAHPVIGNPNTFVGDRRLRAETVAQGLKRQSPASRVVAIAAKDRAAVFSVGRGADLSLWYDPSVGRFTSSTFCTAALPPWVDAYQEQHPLAALLVPWRAADPKRYLELQGPDAAVGEQGFAGSTFPHDPRVAPRPFVQLQLLPAMSEYVVGLAEAAVRETRLGQDAAPDLLVLGISGTDSVGHAFGPHSWEYLDHLRIADAAVGRWLALLERQTPLRVMITSDHGVAALPERSRAEGRVAGRVFTAQLQATLEVELDRAFGADDWFAAIVNGFVYFTARAEQRADFEAIASWVQQRLARVEGIAAVHRVGAAPPPGMPEAERRLVMNSVGPESDVDLMMETQPHHIFALGRPPGSGTHHGSGQDYDRQVPLLFYGAGIRPFRQASPTDQLRAAATLARLLGVLPPAQSEGPALELSPSGGPDTGATPR